MFPNLNDLPTSDILNPINILSNKLPIFGLKFCLPVKTLPIVPLVLVPKLEMGLGEFFEVGLFDNAAWDVDLAFY